MQLEYSDDQIFDLLQKGNNPISIAKLNNFLKPDVMDEYGRLFAAAPELLEASQEAQIVIEKLINATPTGDLRNYLCDLSIKLLKSILSATKGNLINQ